MARFGVVLPIAEDDGQGVQPGWPEIRDVAIATEAAGFDSIWVYDHLLFRFDGRTSGIHEAWTVLTAAAAVTTTPELGILVMATEYRNPALLAKMAATLDHISGGRLILGIGAGWFEKDYDQFGYEFGTAGSRIADLAQAMPRIRARWAASNPVPTRQIPVMIGGGGERKTLRVVAEHADQWHSFGDVDTLVRKSAILDEHGADVGRDTAALVERSVGVGAPPSEVADALVAAGVTLFTVGTGGPDYDLSLAAEWVAWRDAQG